MTPKRKLRPVLDGDWWLIGATPELDGLLPPKTSDTPTEPVDHHVFRDPGDTWHLWGCVRGTSVGRILYHWQTDDPFSWPWTPTGEIIRVDTTVGESHGASPGEGANRKEECIQSPFFINHNGVFHMFYGGGGVAPGAPDRPESDREADKGVSQMCLMTSPDGVTWTRHRNADGHSRLFVGPGPTRDPCIIRIGDTWTMYYAGAKNGDIDQPVFWARTSSDLIQWSDPILVHEDPAFGAGRWDTECPFVVEKEGWFYLFRTEDYYQARTHVFRSADPLDFGRGDDSAYHIGDFPAAAPEFFDIAGKDVVTSNHNPPLGTQMCHVRWVADD